jgi:pyruvate,orthophosphate dikinase
MYGDVVMGVQPRNETEHEPFDAVMDKLKTKSVSRKTDLDRGTTCRNWSSATRP